MIGKNSPKNHQSRPLRPFAFATKAQKKADAKTINVPMIMEPPLAR